MQQLAASPDGLPAIGLNCAERNTAAKRVYRELGFEAGLHYEECELTDSITAADDRDVTPIRTAG